MRSTMQKYSKNSLSARGKKLIVLAAFILLPFFSQAQTAFDKFEGQDNIVAVTVNKKMFELMSKVKMDASDKDAQAYMALLKKLDNLKVFTTSNSKPASDMKASVLTYLKSNPLDELMRINDGGKNVKIYVKSGASSSQVRELLMFIEGSGKNNETVLLSLTGNFDLDEISALTEKMKLPGGNELKKASKK